MIFKDRTEAGQRLAEKLTEYVDQANVIVLALPRGGVPVAYEVAQALNAPLDIFLVRKLGVPGHEELAFGAVATGNVRVLNPSVVNALRLADEEIDDALVARISYGVQDTTIVDWNAAMVIDRDGDDVRAVLEFANVELLEVRYLDQKLDRALEEAYDQLSRRKGRLKRMLGHSGADLRRVAELQVEESRLTHAERIRDRLREAARGEGGISVLARNERHPPHRRVDHVTQPASGPSCIPPGKSAAIGPPPAPSKSTPAPISTRNFPRKATA